MGLLENRSFGWCGWVHLSVGSQIILSPNLIIQNCNHTQEHKYLNKKPFLFEGKNHGTNSKSIYYYQINYNNSQVYA